MRIAQIAPPWYPIPPAGYGGIERVVYDLTEGLVAAGCDVTVCAPAGSKTSGHHVPTVTRPIGMNLTEAQKHRHLVEASRAAYRAALEAGADLVHDHTDARPPRDFPLPIVRTVHGPVTDAAVDLYRQMSRRGDRFVAISYRQRELFENAARERFGNADAIAFADVIYNPLDVAGTRFYPVEEKRGYLAFLGRCHWEKAPDAAIRVAQAADVPLMMALRVTSEERSYFEAVVRPLVLSVRNLAKLVGEVDGQEKDELIGRARAVLFPSPWEEPFGLVMAEASARGTPVIALARGAAPELITNGVTGILCADEEEMVRAVPRVLELDPAACRARAEQLFDRDAIARRHLALYVAIMEGRSCDNGANPNIGKAGSR